MLVYFMRHGIAFDRLDPACPPDPERPLTDAGRARTRAAARGLLELDPQIDTVITSPFVRARETAELTCEVLRIPPQAILESEALWPEIEPDDSVAALSELVAPTSTGALVTGHAPNLDLIVSYLLAGGGRPLVALKKAGIALLDVDSDWVAGGASLVWLMPPRALRRLGGA